MKAELGTWNLVLGTWWKARRLASSPHRGSTELAEVLIASSARRIPPSSFLLPPSPRSGITLMEVLISIFIMSVGLLGLLALLPLGAFKMAQAIRDDRASTLARSALDDLAIRGYLRPEMWLINSTSGTPVLDPTTGALSPLPPYAIDPLVLSNLTLNPIPPVTFPGPPAPPPPLPAGQIPLPAGAAVASRITLRSVPGGSAMSYALAERLFISDDDVVYNIPQNPDFRTTVAGWTVGADGDWGVAGTDDNGDGVVDDPGEAGWPGSDDGSPVNAAGDYSWLVTISPSLDEMRGGGGAGLRNFSAAAVVFQKRNLTIPPNGAQPTTDRPPSERMVYADFLTSGVAFGGGDVRLRTTNAAPSVLQQKWLDLKPNQWLMLSASFVDPYLDSSPGADDGRRTLLAWYRIAAVDEATQFDAASGAWWRYVTLAGPDWPAITVGSQTIYDDADTSAASMGLPTVYATIFEGVAAVHEQTIKLEGFSIWAP